MLQWRSSRISRIGNGDYVPVRPEMLPENRIIRLADFPVLLAEHYCRSPHEVNRLRLR